MDGYSWSKQLVKPGTSAVVGAAATSEMFPGGSVLIMGKKVLVMVLGAIPGFGSAFVSSFINGLILPAITEDQRLQSYESIVVSMGSSGLAFAVIPSLIAIKPTSSQMKELAILGAVVEVVSQ